MLSKSALCSFCLYLFTYLFVYVWSYRPVVYFLSWSLVKLDKIRLKKRNKQHVLQMIINKIKNKYRYKNVCLLCFAFFVWLSKSAFFLFMIFRSIVYFLPLSFTQLDRIRLKRSQQTLKLKINLFLLCLVSGLCCFALLICLICLFMIF